MLARQTPQRQILFRTVGRFFTGLSDTAKAFLIILITDTLLGYHSEEGWTALLKLLSGHYGVESEVRRGPRGAWGAGALGLGAARAAPWQSKAQKLHVEPCCAPGWPLLIPPMHLPPDALAQESGLKVFVAIVPVVMDSLFKVRPLSQAVFRKTFLCLCRLHLRLDGGSTPWRPCTLRACGD